MKRSLSSLSIFHVAWHIAWRYVVKRSGSKFSKWLSIISVAGLTFGTAALVIILSVFSGFSQLLDLIYSDFSSSIRITSRETKSFEMDSAVFHRIENCEGVEKVWGIVEIKALLQYNGRETVATLKGVPVSYNYNGRLDSIIHQGRTSLKSGEGFNRMILGFGLAEKLYVGIHLLNHIYCYVPQKGKQSLLGKNYFRSIYAAPVGTFKVQYDIDNEYAYLPIDAVQKLCEYDSNRFTSLELSITGTVRETVLIAQLKEVLGASFLIQDKYQQNETAYQVLKTEENSSFLILLFVLLIASFSLAATLIMLTVEKERDISLWTTLGLPQRVSQMVFLLTGLLITLFSGVAGITLGSLVCLLQQAFGFIPLGSEGSFFIDAYPVAIQWKHIGNSLWGVVLVGMITSFYASFYSNRFRKSIGTALTVRNFQ